MNLDEKEHAYIKELLTFHEMPSKDNIRERAHHIATHACQQQAKKAMIGGAPYLMPCLERELLNRNIEPLYAFSLRESEEVRKEDGSVEKKIVFKHAGFITAT